MNKAFKKYKKLRYQHTRYGREKLRTIFLLKRAMASGVAAQGSAMISQIRSADGDKAKKAIAIAECVINTNIAAMKAYQSIPLPAWYK